MRNLLLTCLLLTASMSAFAAQNEIGVYPTQVIRSGDTIVIPNTCLVFDLAVLNEIIPEGRHTLQQVLLRAFTARRDLTQEEAALCLGREPMEMIEKWVVAALGNATDRPVKLLVDGADGTITRANSPIRIPIGSECAGESNVYESQTPGKNKMWRNPINMPGYAVICELLSVPAANYQE